MGEASDKVSIDAEELSDLRSLLFAEFLESVEFRYAYQLDNFQGDSQPFEPLTPELHQLLSQECLPPSTRPSKGALLRVTLTSCGSVPRTTAAKIA